jgi:hypothetical protein
MGKESRLCRCLFPCMGLVLFGTKECGSFQPNKKDAKAGAKIVTSTNTETDNYALDNQKYTWYGNQWMPPPLACASVYEGRYYDPILFHTRYLIHW